jgi:formylglycine-generating enzyme required for sulfatase activity
MALTIKGVEYAFRWCPPGTFMMGSPQDEVGRYDTETLHQVVLSRGFWLLETPVTQAMWASVMGNNPSNLKGSKLPVECVSWNDCQEYIAKLNGLGVAPKGYRFSLPTEAQWEYACRAGTTTAYYFGDTLTKEQANFDGNKTSEVGSYPANAWGLYDMHGNVYEWCMDWYGDYPSGSVTDPTGAVEGSDRVLRGGYWNTDAKSCRSALRIDGAPSYRSDDCGLRVSLVCEENPEKKK